MTSDERVFDENNLMSVGSLVLLTMKRVASRVTIACCMLQDQLPSSLSMTGACCKRVPG